MVCGMVACVTAVYGGVMYGRVGCDGVCYCSVGVGWCEGVGYGGVGYGGVR